MLVGRKLGMGDNGRAIQPGIDEDCKGAWKSVLVLRGSEGWCECEEEGGVCVQLAYGQGHIDGLVDITSPSQGLGSDPQNIHSSPFASWNEGNGAGRRRMMMMMMMVLQLSELMIEVTANDPGIHEHSGVTAKSCKMEKCNEVVGLDPII